ncbi:MAG: hypothetical protein JWM39_243 [Parcubacteria group bacterium]|nr:hypothetical protein [Parcubacteria group bacterium]
MLLMTKRKWTVLLLFIAGFGLIFGGGHAMPHYPEAASVMTFTGVILLLGVVLLAITYLGSVSTAPTKPEDLR